MRLIPTLALLLLAALSPAAALERLGTPIIGIEQTGACRTFTLRDQSSNAEVPLGCVDTGTHSYTSLIGRLDVRGGSSSLINVRTTQPANAFVATGAGAYVDYCAAAGCDTSGPHLLAQVYLRTTSRHYADAQQVGFAADFINEAGYLPAWQANIGYTNAQPSTPGATSETTVGGGFDARTYRNTVANCTSGTTAPTGTGTNISDGGTCRWTYIGAGLNSGATGVAFNTRSRPGGGNAWGFITDHVVEAGFGNGSAYGQELDCNNENKESYAGGAFGMVCVYIGGGGPNAFPQLAALFIDNANATSGSANPYGYQYGIYMGGQPGTPGSVVKQGAFVDASLAQYSLWGLGGRSHTAFIFDESNSATILKATGNHQYGIDLSNANISQAVALALPATTYITYKGNAANYMGYNNQVNCLTYGQTNSGTNYLFKSCDSGAFSVKGDLIVDQGAFKPTMYTVAGVFACGSTSKGSVVTFSDLAAAPTYRQTGFSGGGSISAPGYCNGTSWEIH